MNGAGAVESQGGRIAILDPLKGRSMMSPEGGFHSSLDADSEGHEGRFYVWDAAELDAHERGRCTGTSSKAVLPTPRTADRGWK